MEHTLFENSRITPVLAASGTIINTTVDGTAQGTIAAADYEYHAFVYAGSVANTGTVFVYALGASQTNAVLGSMIVGSSNGNLVYEVKSDALLAAGTGYTHLGALVKVDASGTWRGAAFWLSHQPRSVGTTPGAMGWNNVGTALY